MLFEINTAYCSQCKSFVPVFDSLNINYSTTEINCTNCGKILFVIRSEMQYQYDSEMNLKDLEEYIKKENVKSSSKFKIKKLLPKSKAA